MFSIFVERVFCIFILISYTIATATSDNFKDDSLDRGAHSDRQGLWFGPRLGKRSRDTANNDNRQTFQRLLEAADVLKFFYDRLPYEMQVEEPLKAKQVFASKLSHELESSPDKRTYDNVEFTPRLGRRIPDIMPVTTEEEIFQSDPVMVNPLTNLFSPRLGRNVQFSPRLGRELNYDCLMKFFVELNSYVLLAADPDDFRNIAKKIVPENLANKLARFATDISVKDNSPDESDESDYYYESDDEEPTENTKDESVSDDNVKELEKSGENMYVRDWKTRVNFDELVERVKDRLAKELSQKLKKHMLHPTYSMHNNLGQKGIQNENKQTNDKNLNDRIYYPNKAKIEKSYDYNNFKNNQQPKEHFENVNRHIKTNYENLTNKVYPPPNIGHEYELLKNNKNTYHKVNAHEKYESVVMKPLMNYQGLNDYEINHSKNKEHIDEGKHSNEMNHEEDNSYFHSKNKKAPTYDIEETLKSKSDKNYKYASGNTKYNTEIKDEESDLEQHNYDKRLPKQFNKDRNVFVGNVKNKPALYDEFDLTSKNKNDSYEDYIIPKVENVYASEETSTPSKNHVKKVKQVSFDSNERSRFKVRHSHNPQSKKIIKSERLHKQRDESIKSTDDYAEAIDKSQEIKARTESLWYNYDDDKPKSTRDDRSEDSDTMSSVAPTHKAKHKGTMIPTREYFKMASPNYYISLPTVAEKYDPEEPLPEKDREREVIKHFDNPPASINKKVKLI